MTDIICEKCGSREIKIKEYFKKINDLKNKKTSDNIKLKKYICTCGHTWEERL